MKKILDNEREDFQIKKISWKPKKKLGANVGSSKKLRSKGFNFPFHQRCETKKRLGKQLVA